LESFVVKENSYKRQDNRKKPPQLLSQGEERKNLTPNPSTGRGVESGEGEGGVVYCHLLQRTDRKQTEITRL